MLPGSRIGAYEILGPLGAGGMGEVFRALSAGPICVVDVKITPEVSLSASRSITRPATLLARSGFDISHDGKRLLMTRTVQNDDGRGPALAVVQDWFAPFRK